MTRRVLMFVAALALVATGCGAGESNQSSLVARPLAYSLTGAVELAARYSSTDLDDGPYQGGTLDAITLGANWYLNPNTRLMFNWVRSDGESPDPTEDNPQSATGVVNTFQTRFQVDF